MWPKDFLQVSINPRLSEKELFRSPLADKITGENSKLGIYKNSLFYETGF